MAEVVQRFVLPRTDLCTDLQLYAHLSSDAHYVFSSRTLEFFRNGVAIFDTYFNSFSTGKWKRHTLVDSLACRIRLRGKFVLRFGENRPHKSMRVVCDVVVDSPELDWHEVQIPFARLGNGTLFLHVTCLSDNGCVAEACLVTDSKPRITPRVGLVITTFNRPHYLRGNLARLQQAMSGDPTLARLLHVVVVDNARNLNLRSDDSLTYLTNQNLGGAGGFSRGLLHLREQEGFTHALFMDDDISFEVESVRRAAMFAAFGRHEDTCVSGAMFLESVPHVQYESGAVIDFHNATRLLHICGSDMDMHDWRQVMLNDAFDRPVGYGAWWFFLFPLDLSGTDLAFPFFIRGDDMLFGYKYAKRIVTMNGVGVWHTPFDYKDSATTLYYNQRNTEVVRAIAGPADLGRWPALAHFVRATLRENLTYRYVTAAYRIRAMRDFLEGPAFWRNVDIPALHDELRAGDTEAPRPLAISPDEGSIDYYAHTYGLNRLRGLLQVLTLNGHLLPWFILERTRHRPTRSVPLQKRGFSAVFGQQRVLYRYAPTGEGFVAAHSKRKFLRNLKDLAAVSFEAMRRYSGVRDAYRAAYRQLVAVESWKQRLGLDAEPGITKERRAESGPPLAS